MQEGREADKWRFKKVAIYYYWFNTSFATTAPPPPSNAGISLDQRESN